MKKHIEALLQKVLPSGIPAEVSVPEQPNFGHYSTNAALRLGKARNQNPLTVAKEIADAVEKAAPAGLLDRVETAAPGFINFWVSKEALLKELGIVYKNIKKFGQGVAGKGQTVVIEYSQPNIAKKMHVGHLRTTVLGEALANVFEALGYKVIRWNYIGDWGTQFGKLIAAYKLWGEKKEVQANPIEELQKLYVRFHEEVKKEPALEDRGREEFRKLEEGDKENKALWEWFKKESLKEFNRLYKTLGIKFDTFIGESFFQKATKELAGELFKNGMAEKSEGSLIIKLDKFNLPPALIEKSDGTTLYLGRDIANIQYRIRKFRPAKIVYIVGNEQTLHFEQLFAIAELLGITGTDLMHVKYGLVLGEGGKKLATREGRTILAEEVLSKAADLAKKIVGEKNPELGEKAQNAIAEAVGIGALKYTNLKENRTSDIVFDWGKMLDFTGDSAPYLQYTYARFMSILRKAGKAGKPEWGKLSGETELALVRKFLEFPEEIQKSARIYGVNNLAKYAYELSNLLNKFYESTPILKEADADRKAAFLGLIKVAAAILEKALGLLGIKTLKQI